MKEIVSPDAGFLLSLMNRGAGILLIKIPIGT